MSSIALRAPSSLKLRSRFKTWRNSFSASSYFSPAASASASAKRFSRFSGSVATATRSSASLPPPLLSLSREQALGLGAQRTRKRDPVEQILGPRRVVCRDQPREPQQRPIVVGVRDEQLFIDRLRLFSLPLSGELLGLFGLAVGGRR